MRRLLLPTEKMAHEKKYSLSINVNIMGGKNNNLTA
jgi:hypothetical protein